MHPFDAATAVGDGGEVVLDPEWSGLAAPHGGVLAAILLRAMRGASADTGHAPQSLLVQYARAPTIGGATVAVSVDRVGRRASQLSASLTQDGRECVRALATFTAAFGAAADDWSEPLPEMPAYDAVAPSPRQPWWPPFTSRLQYRVLLGGEPFSGADALTGGWFCADPPREIDAPFLAYLADAWFPSPFVRLGAAAAVPTLDLSVHFLSALREPLPPGPVAARFATATAHRGLFVEDGAMWAADGTPLAYSRQSALRAASDPPHGRRRD